MKKVFFINNWGENNGSLLTRYSKQTPNNNGAWKDLVGTSNMGEADYFIALEAPRTNTPIEKTIFIKREPNYIRPYNNLPYKHMVDYSSTNTGVTYWLNKTYDDLLNLEYPNKDKKISCVVSTKHNPRNNYIKRLFKNKPDIDLYGKGHDRNYHGDAYKGMLNYDGNCKFKGLVDYEYSIVMENSQQQNYWTEKLADAYLSWCMPIYWGCPNISDYFPDNSFRLIDIKSENPLVYINEIINEPLTEVEIEALHKARVLILDEYNIWEIIHKKIKEIENGD